MLSHNSWSKLLQKVGFWFALTGIVFSIGISEYVAFQTFQNPYYEKTSIDYYWTIFYAVLILGVGITFWIKKGKVLFLLSLLGLALLLLIPMLFAGIGLDVVILSWLILVSISLGDAFIWQLEKLDQVHFSERVLLDLTLGLGVLMAVIAVMGFLHLFYPVAAYLLLAILTFLFFPGAIKRLGHLGKQTVIEYKRKFYNDGIRWEALGLGLFLVFFIGPFIWAVAPTIRYDALSYHLAAPVIYVKEHGIRQILESGTTTWIHYAEMLYTFAMLLVGQPLPGMIHLLMGILTAGFSYLLGSRLLSKRVGILSALLFFSTPLVGFESSTAYIDFFVALFCTAMFFSALLWWKLDSIGCLLLSGVFAGFAIGIKLTSTPAVLACFMLLFMGFISRTRSFKTFLLYILLFGIPTIALSVPWMVRDWLWMGDPLFPFGKNLLSSGTLLSSTPIQGGNPPVISSILKTIQSFLEYFWNLVASSSIYYRESPGGILTALPFLSLPWFFLHYSGYSKILKRDYFFLFFSLILCVGLLYITHNALIRYMSPSFSLMAALAALNINALWECFQNNRHKYFLTGISVFVLLTYSFVTRVDLNVRTMDYVDRYPIRLFLGKETEDHFLSTNLPVYDVFQFLNKQSSQPYKVLSVGNEFRLYSSSIIACVNDSVEAWNVLASANDEKSLAHNMEAYKYDYLLLDTYQIENRPDKFHFDMLTTSFLDQYTQLVYVNKGIYLYKIYPSGGQNYAAVVNLLKNVGFENTNPDGTVTEWNRQGILRIETNSYHVHSGKKSLYLQGPGDNYGYVFQTLPVEAGEIYTGGYWIFSDQPAVLQLQIYWLDKNKNFIRSDMLWKTNSSSWNWYQFSTKAPENSQYAQFYVSISNKGKAWFDDLCFVKGQRCP